MRSWVLLGSVVVVGLLNGCSKDPLPAGKYEAMMLFTMPKGTELVMDGKVFAAVTGQPVNFELAEGVGLASAKSLTARFHTSCGATIEQPLSRRHDDVTRGLS